jgi:hypothetical protein
MAWVKNRAAGVASVVSVVCLSLMAGCQGRGALIPPSDPDLRKTAAEFAADSAKRQYPSNAPRGGDLQALASVDYGVFNRIEMMNLSGEEMDDFEVWINEKYAFHATKWPAKTLKKINFATLYDRDGKPFPMDNQKVRITKIEVLKDGKVYNVPTKLAE